MPSAPLHFPCPACGIKRLWNPNHAGKRTKCSCGQIIAIPKEPPVFIPPTVVIEREEEDGTITTVPAPRREKIHSERLAIPMRKALGRDAPADPPPPSLLRDHLLPALLVAAGLFLCFADGIYQGDAGWKPLNEVSGSVTVNIIASLVLAIGAVFLASAMGGICFTEPVPIIIHKLCAVALAPGAVSSILTHWIGGINGDILGVMIGLACCFALFILLFRMAMADRVVCVMLLFIIRTAVAYALWKYQGLNQGSAI